MVKNTYFSIGKPLPYRKTIIACNDEKLDINLEDMTQYSKPSVNFYSPEDILLGKELVELLGEFLNNNLTPLEKKVFFYTCKQYKYNEIAELMGERSKKIDNAIQRVRKKIIAYLSEYTKD